MVSLPEAIGTYVTATRSIEALPSSTESSFYPDIKVLLSAVLKAERLPFDIITGTSEARARGRDMPDFVLGDSSLFVAVYGEVKRPEVTSQTWRFQSKTTTRLDAILRRPGSYFSAISEASPFSSATPRTSAIPRSQCHQNSESWKRRLIFGRR